MRRTIFLTSLAILGIGASVCLASTDYNAGWNEYETGKPAETTAPIQTASSPVGAISARLTAIEAEPALAPSIIYPSTPKAMDINRKAELEKKAPPQASAVLLPQPQIKVQPNSTAPQERGLAERKGFDSKVQSNSTLSAALTVSKPAPLTSPGIAPLSASGFGTGFFVTPDIIATSWHIIRGKENLTIIHLGVSTPATVVAQDENNDLALLKISNPAISRKASPLPIIDIRLVNVGEKVYSVGFPDPVKLGFRPKITDGLISSIGGERDNPTCYQISAPVQPGNSGSPLLNARGQVVGIVSKKWATNKYQNISYAVKSNHLINLLLTLPEGVIIPEEPVFASAVEGSAIMLLARDAVVTVVQHGAE